VNHGIELGVELLDARDGPVDELGRRHLAPTDELGLVGRVEESELGRIVGHGSYATAVGARVIVLTGLPGSGKSTLARALAVQVPNARVLDKDVIRDALFGPCDYTATESQVSVAAMLDAARYHLGRGRTVVFDGMTFSRRQYLDAVKVLAKETGSALAVVVCDVPVELAIARVEADEDHPALNRDADVVRRVAADMEEPDGDYLTVDMTEDPAGGADLVLAYLESIER
jgi:predicted kinase